ncbi:MAG: hypothetical protein AAF845_10960 [Bacteroidota bacterium]
MVALALMAGAASGQEARLHVLADSVSIGERFEIAVAVDHAPGAQVAFPAVPLADPEAGPLVAFGDVEAFDLRRLPPEIRGDVRTDSAVYTVAAFAVDEAVVGPVEVAVDSARVQTAAASVPVRSELTGPPPHEPAPLGPPDDFPSPVALWAVTGLVALALLGGAVWGLVQTLRARETPAPARQPPYPAARARLEALDAEAPQTPEAVEAHVVALRGVVRVFLARRLGVAAREATTAELMGLLAADARVSEGATEAVGTALQPTDLVAFARVRPPAEVVAQMRAAARSAVDAVERDVRAAEAPRPEAEPSPSVPA